MKQLLQKIWEASSDDVLLWGFCFIVVVLVVFGVIK